MNASVFLAQTASQEHTHRWSRNSPAALRCSILSLSKHESLKHEWLLHFWVFIHLSHIKTFFFFLCLIHYIRIRLLRCSMLYLTGWCKYYEMDLQMYSGHCQLGQEEAADCTALIFGESHWLERVEQKMQHRHTNTQGKKISRSTQVRCITASASSQRTTNLHHFIILTLPHPLYHLLIPPPTHRSFK